MIGNQSPNLVEPVLCSGKGHNLPWSGRPVTAECLKRNYPGADQRPKVHGSVQCQGGVEAIGSETTKDDDLDPAIRSTKDYDNDLWEGVPRPRRKGRKHSSFRPGQSEQHRLERIGGCGRGDRRLHRRAVVVIRRKRGGGPYHFRAALEKARRPRLAW